MCLGSQMALPEKGSNARNTKAWLTFLTHSLKLYVWYVWCSSLQIPTSYFPLDSCLVVWQFSLSSASSSTTSLRWTLCCGSGESFQSSTQIKVIVHNRCVLTNVIFFIDSIQCNDDVSSQKIQLHWTHKAPRCKKTTVILWPYKTHIHPHIHNSENLKRYLIPDRICQQWEQRKEN